MRAWSSWQRIAFPRACHAFLAVARDAVAGAHDTTKAFCVEMEHCARYLVFIALHRLGQLPVAQADRPARLNTRQGTFYDGTSLASTRSFAGGSSVEHTNWEVTSTNRKGVEALAASQLLSPEPQPNEPKFQL